MDATDEARDAISMGITALIARRDKSTDTAEKATIKEAIEDLQAQRRALNVAELDAAADAVAAATVAFERCIAAAKIGSLDEFRSSVEGAISQLQTAQSQVGAAVNVPMAAAPPAAAPPGSTAGTSAAAVAPPVAPVTAPARSPPAASGPAAAPGSALPPINPSRDFGDLGAEYQAYFDACIPDPARARDLGFFARQMEKSRSIYEATGAGLDIPWHFISLLHGMECSFKFDEHLHNGDPLTARTVRVPAGRPPTGSPPFSWQDSARDALIFKGFAHQSDWSLPRVLYRLETYNGFGYRNRGLPSAYLWSFSNLYKTGKFIADGVFDPNKPSEQCGAAVALRTLQLAGGL